MVGVQVEVRRSPRRGGPGGGGGGGGPGGRGVAAHREGERVVVVVPAGLSRAAEARWVEQMVCDVLAREDRSRRRGPRASDDALMARAVELGRRHLDGAAQPAVITWVETMNHRWGSCTPANRTIRISHRLREFPPWVLDYVIIHELAHLLVDGHGPPFWDLVERYERTERARGYLDGFAAAAHLSVSEESA